MVRYSRPLDFHGFSEVILGDHSIEQVLLGTLATSGGGNVSDQRIGELESSNEILTLRHSESRWL